MKLSRAIGLLLITLPVCLPGAEVYTYWIEPCAGDGAARSGCAAADPELARWAIDAWQKAGGDGLHFTAAAEDETRVRFHWLRRQPNLYGDAREVQLNGKPVWQIEVQPDLAQFGASMGAAAEKDSLFRDEVVYLTCQHELGHVLGIPHTADFADIMYSFEYGGDVRDYFGRYRRLLKARADIREHSGISSRDRDRVTKQYAGR